MPENGRPSIYSEELAERIADRMTTSDRGLAELCDGSDDLPGSTTVWRWMHEKPGFRSRIQRAREHQADFLVFQARRILDEADAYARENNSAGVQLAKAKADYRLKLAPKIAPRTMGDRLKLGGDPDAPPIGTVSETVRYDPAKATPEEFEQAQKLAKALRDRGGLLK